MYSLGINQNSVYNSQSDKVYANSKPVIPTAQTSPIKTMAKNVSFTSAAIAPPTLRTELATKEEKQKYALLSANLDNKGRKNLELLLRNGVLLNTNSSDKSSTMDNLYKMLATPRVAGIAPQNALAETVSALARPEAITQTIEDIPQPFVTPVLQSAQKNPNIKTDEINEKTINVDHSATCVATSIEFKLAKQKPAEFARFAEGLTSPKISVGKTIQLKNLADNTLDAVWLLNEFEIPYEMKDFNVAKLTFAPDKNAILRAQVQNSAKDRDERSLIDVLMQSTFMNVGSQQAYDSLTDTRGGKFSQKDKGLIDFEKTFTESVVEDRNEISVTYQEIDENNKITGTTDFKTIKKQILESLSLGEGVVIGYTYYIKNKELPIPDPDKKPDDEILEGHEITIVGARQDKNGKLRFICFDSDDKIPHYIEYSEDYIIPKIHHAGLPKEVAEKDVKYAESWVESMNAYKEAKMHKDKEA